jgi:acyl-CoA thioesterase-1
MMIVLLSLSGCSSEESEVVDPLQFSGTIVALGDSLTAGYGLDEEQSYPALLQKKLNDEGYQYRVINAGVSAETSSGTLARIEWILTMNPDIVILETGANDGLRGLDPQLVEDNIREILQILESRQVTVLLVGMKMVMNLGPLYVEKFNSIYPELAEEFDVELMPFFLEDVAMKTELNLADGVHPNEKGYQLITENIYPYVVKVIEKRKGNG